MLRIPCALLVSIAAVSPALAAPATLDLDPDHPPVVVESVPERAPGAAVLRFGTLEVVSLPAVVVVLEEGVSPPAGAQPLGPTGRS